MLASIIQSGKGLGMRAMDDVLFEYVRDGKITAHDAYMKATDKARFEPLVEGQPG
jgi:twitching motility protein PilT